MFGRKKTLVDETKIDDKYIVSYAVQPSNTVLEQTRIALKELIDGDSKFVIFPKDTKLIRIRNGVTEHIL